VRVDLRADGKRHVVARVRANRYGVFSGRFRSTVNRGFVGASIAEGSDAALPFSLVVPPDRPGCVWGTC
jgi:hypothetical protein